MSDSIKNRASVSTSPGHRDGVSPTPWRVIKAFEDEPARIIDADDEEVAVELIDADAALIVEAVNERKRDEALIAALLYHHLEDFAEAVASDGFTKVVKAAFKRLGLKYEPFGPDALEVVEKRKKELAHD